MKTKIIHLTYLHVWINAFEDYTFFKYIWQYPHLTIIYLYTDSQYHACSCSHCYISETCLLFYIASFIFLLFVCFAVVGDISTNEKRILLMSPHKNRNKTTLQPVEMCCSSDDQSLLTENESRTVAEEIQPPYSKFF